MAENNNATCSICGKGYHMCMSCKDSLALAPYKIHTDTAEHYKVYQIIRGLSTNVYDKDEARAKFKNVDLSDLNTFRPHIKNIIKDILKENKSAAKVVETKIAKVEAEKSVVENAEDSKNDIESVEKTIVSRKKNFKAEVE